jgi:hypothetical protein
MKITMLSLLLGFYAAPAAAQAPLSPPWDSVAAILQTSGTFNAGYYRYNFPRRDLQVKIGDVTIAPGLALGTWAGFSGDPGSAVLMGDLVLTAAEVAPVLAALDRANLSVSAVHNHLVGEEPKITYVHYHGEGNATDLARRLNTVLGATATPRPVAAPAPAALSIDTTLVFTGLGRSGRAQGNLAQLSFVLVPDTVRMDGKVVNAGQAYATPINIQAVDQRHALATGDFTVLASRVQPVRQALTRNGITVTALHSHLIGETPKLYYMHFWADGSLTDVVRGLRAALDAAGAPKR